MPKTKRASKRIDKRQEEQKKLLIDQLRKIPIIQIACEKIGVSRATYYRWANEDPAFASEVDAANVEGTAFINDMAESQLISAIKDKNFPAISFWLRNRHKAYGDKLRVDVRPVEQQKNPTDEQLKLVADALQLASDYRKQVFMPPQPPYENNEEHPTTENGN